MASIGSTRQLMTVPLSPKLEMLEGDEPRIVQLKTPNYQALSALLLLVEQCVLLAPQKDNDLIVQWALMEAL